VAFEELLAVAHRVERAGARPDGAEAHASQAVHDPADAEEVPQVVAEGLRRRMLHVPAGQRGWGAGPAQGVADGDFAAEGVPAAGGDELAKVVGIGLDEHRHAQAGELESVRHGLLVTEVRQDDEYAIDLLAMPPEQVRTLAGVGIGLEAAELG